MHPNEFMTLDFGGYLYGMFFACAGIMAAYGLMAGIKSVKGIEYPLAILAAMAGYWWWSGESFDFLWDWMR
jgi:hypothetical protein